MLKDNKWEILTIILTLISIILYISNIFDDDTLNNLIVFIPILILTIRLIVSKPRIILKLQSRSIEMAELKVALEYENVDLKTRKEFNDFLGYIVEKDKDIKTNTESEDLFKSLLVVNNDPINVLYDRRFKELKISMATDIKYKDFYSKVEKLFNKIIEFYALEKYSCDKKNIQISIKFEEYNPFIKKMLKNFHVKEDVSISYKKQETYFDITYKEIIIYSNNNLKDLNNIIKNELFFNISHRIKKLFK